jgi:RNA dependent RNA polymerase.
MLMRKRILQGPRVQLPSSMKKVEASTNPIDPKMAYVLVNKAGVDPSSNNQYLGIILDPQNKTKVPKDFKIKPLSNMIRRLLYSSGVPKIVLEKYERSATRDMRKTAHAFVRGVADPTESIPPNYVFITGLSGIGAELKKVFITRSPCILATDACVIKVVTSKPKHMRKDDFEWLNSLPFGIVIFGFPKNGMKPLPPMIANGDLDGDRYFLLWENSVMSHVNVKPLSDEPILKTAGAKTSTRKEDPDWFIKAQTFMADPSNTEISAMMGQLFNASAKAADDDRIQFLSNPSATALGKAFNQALDNKKHGNKIALPSYLWHTIGKRFHKHLTNVGDDIIFRKEIAGRWYNGRVLEYPIEPNQKGTLAKVLYENGDKDEMCVEELATHVKFYEKWARSQKQSRSFKLWDESNISFEQSDDRTQIKIGQKRKYQHNGKDRNEVLQNNHQPKRRKARPSDCGRNNSSSSNVFSSGALFHKHAKNMHYDGDHYKNMYWAYEIVAVPDEKTKKYKVRSPDLSISLMSHTEIERHVKEYEEFSKMQPGSLFAFSDHIGYYCTNENDSPESISVELAQKPHSESCPKLVSKICKSILNSDYNMEHFGKLSAKAKFKSGSKVQVDLSVVNESNACAKMTRRGQESKRDDTMSTGQSVGGNTCREAYAKKLKALTLEDARHKDSIHGLYAQGTLVYKHAKNMHYDGDHYKNMYWECEIVAVPDEKTKKYKVRSPDLSISLMSHTEIERHVKEYEEFSKMQPGSLFAFSDHIGYYCANENDSPESISVELAQKPHSESCPKLVSKICKSILNSDYNMEHFGKLSAKAKFKSGSKVQVISN